MNFDFDIVMILALFTIGSVVVFAIVSRTRAAKAQDHHEDAAVAERQRAEPDVTGREEDAPLTGRSWSEERGNNPPTPMPPRN